MHRSFERIAAASPERVALTCEERSLTFGELNTLANRIARLLVARGVGAGEPIGLMLGRGLFFVAGVLGILKSGAAYVPIDPACPDELRRSVINDAELKHVLCDRDSRMLSLASVQQHLLDEPDVLSELVGEPMPEEPPMSSTLAYVIYTSGSTGKPKGVRVDHANLGNFAKGMRALGFDGSGCWAASASFFSDLSLQGLCHLMQGGHLLVLSDKEKVDTDALRLRVRQHCVDVLDCTPTLLQSWLDQGAEDILPSLIVGGEPLTQALWRRLAGHKRPGVRHFNAYGLTECTVNACIGVIEGDRPHIGHCLADVFGLVLDHKMNPCPRGVAGELYLGGRSVSRGYLGNEELTARCFVADTLTGHPGLLCRTGDAVRQLSDGSFEYLGRSDERVKIKRDRIELDQIACALESHPWVRSALVLATDAEAGCAKLVAFIRQSASVEAGALSTELSAWLRQRLPQYMQPDCYVLVSHWPMTANHKIDYCQLLSAPFPSSGPNPNVHSETAVHKQLREIFSSVLGREDVGIEDNFYDMGGDSILAIRLIAKAAKSGIKFSARQFMSHPTVAALSAVCEGSWVDSDHASVEGLQPLLPIHHRAIIDQLHVGMETFDHFNGGSLFGVPYGLDEHRLRIIHDEFLRKHDALRLAFDLGGPEPVARYLAADAAVFARCVSVEHVSAVDADIPSAVTAICQAHQTAFRLSAGGLFRLVLIRARDLDRLLMLAHHAVGDVVSWHLLVADLAEAVGQSLRGEAVRLHGKTSSYQSWGRYLAECAKTGVFLAERDYWKAQVDRNRMTPVVRNEYSVADVGHWRHLPVVLDKVATSDLLEGVGAFLRVDTNALLLCALYRGLERWNKGKGFCFLLQSHGRHSGSTSLDLSQTVGWFTQNYPLLLNFAPGRIDRDLADVAATLSSVPNHGLGYGVLRFLAREPSLQPVGGEPFQVLLNYLGRFDSMVRDAAPLEFRQEDIGPISHRRLPITVPMAFQGGVYSGILSMNLEFDARQFGDQQMQRLVECIRSELLAIVEFSRELQAETSTLETT
jgi:amino acid adenylation domain-containing protein/non-ribosomal peptide synthase protein (TIGR01720 family)